MSALLLLTLASAAAELLTIGAVLPVLVVAARSESRATIPLIDRLAEWIGASPMVAAALLLTAAAIAATALRLILLNVGQAFTHGVQRDVLDRIFARALRRPYNLFVRQHSSQLLSVLESVTVTGWVISTLVTGTTSLIVAAAIVALLVWIDAATAVIAVASIGLIYLALTLFVQHRSAKISEGLTLMRSARIKTVQEAVGGFRQIILDHSQRSFETRLHEQQKLYGRYATRAHLLANCPRIVVEGAVIILIALIAAWHSLQPGGVVAALPSLGAIALGAQRLLPMVQQAYSGFAHFNLYGDTLRELGDLLDTPITEETASGALVPQTFAKEITLRNVSFAYAAGRPALKDVNLTIRHGERIGIIGRSGSGKSTLIDIITGLLAPDSGEVLVDGEPVVAGWATQIAVVPQTIFLADDSIAANIAFGRGIDPGRVRHASERAGLGEFVGELPQGFDTKVGEGGVRLSGGQRQRIGIARALYKEASLLVLDEATSALDTETEAAVIEAISGLDPELTILLIAHRLSTAAACDRIVRLSSGRIEEVENFESRPGG